MFLIVGNIRVRKQINSLGVLPEEVANILNQIQLFVSNDELLTETAYKLLVLAWSGNNTAGVVQLAPTDVWATNAVS